MTDSINPQLGAKVDEFSSNFYVKTAYVFIGLLGVLALIAVVLGILGFAGFFGNTAVPPWQVGLGCLLGAAIFGGIAAWKYYTAKTHRDAAIIIYSDGFVKTTGSSSLFCRWDEIAAVQNFTNTVTTNGIDQTAHFLKVRRKDGMVFDLGDNKGQNHFTRIEQLEQVLQEGAGKYILPKLNQTLSSGETFSFGRFGVNNTGIVMGDQLIIGWDKVERTKVDFAQLKIVEKVTHKKYKLGAAAETDNLFLFQMLVRQLAGSDKSLR